MNPPTAAPDLPDAASDVPVADRGARSGTVQSIERAFGLLETMADHGGTMGLSQLAQQSGLPLPTIHRLRTLVDLAYLRQDSSRQYVLAPRLIRLGESSGAILSVWAKPHLDRLVAERGESANMAMLDGDQIVYFAQAQSRCAMRRSARPSPPISSPRSDPWTPGRRPAPKPSLSWSRSPRARSPRRLASGPSSPAGSLPGPGVLADSRARLPTRTTSVGPRSKWPVPTSIATGSRGPRIVNRTRRCTPRPSLRSECRAARGTAITS